MASDTPTGNGERRPRLKLASAVMFVTDLDSSLSFYQELLGLELAARAEDAVLLANPDGYQLYLRRVGQGVEHPLGAIGIQYIVWTAESDADLDRCERILKEQSDQVQRTALEGFTTVEGRGPDDVPVVVTYPGPDRAPRHEILQRVYAW